MAESHARENIITTQQQRTAHGGVSRGERLWVVMRTTAKKEWQGAESSTTRVYPPTRASDDDYQRVTKVKMPKRKREDNGSFRRATISHPRTTLPSGPPTLALKGNP